MSTVDLYEYNLVELKSLQRDIDKEIGSRAQEELRKAREQVFAIAKSMGVSIEQLILETGKKSRATKGTTVAAQYRNPAGASQTWTGRGRKPKWFVDALDGGKKLEELRV